MRPTKRRLSLLLAALLCVLLLSACGEKETEVSVCLVNRTGLDLGEIHITSATTDEWGDTLVEAPFEDGQLQQVTLGSFTEKALSEGFNILVYDNDGDLVYDTSFDEQDFQLRDGDYLVFLPPECDTPLDITARYNGSEYDALTAGYEDDGPDGEEDWQDEDQPEEALDVVDIASFTGCWKYDDEPFYMVISDSYEWIAINLYAEQVGPGTVVAEEDGISLYMGDGSYLTSLNQTAYGGLSDEAGNALSAWDYIMLLPAPDDALNQTASFPGGFTNVQIDYPIQMEAHEHPNVSNSLSFNAVMEDGTDDYYSNILIAFQPISGYDAYMTKGAGTAKPYMKHMLDSFMTSMYGDKLLKSFGSDFRDNGNYYSITGYMWLDGSVFAGDLSQPVRGCMEVRYYGPTGYALVATTIALEGRIRNYFDICNNMLTTCTYTAGWSTAPKPVPQMPGAAASQSDPGDYGSPYYWYDEDGDVWYWDGYENIFIGYGDDYYIDDDGQYYESNDAGWDYDDEDYYDDYDPWSDPGDGWDDYAYDDEGWGDYFD